VNRKAGTGIKLEPEKSERGHWNRKERKKGEKKMENKKKEK
jgi:hypothetical protein